MEMHNFLIIKTLSVLISASGVSLCWGSTRVVWSRIAGVPGFLLEGFFFVSTHTHQLHLEVQERWEENKVGSLMVYLDKNIW